MTESEMMLTARQVQEQLGVSSQMAGIYYRELEKITNVKIKTVGRTGRSFTPEQVKVLMMARNIVRSDSTITVSEAMSRAVGLSQMPLEAVDATDTPGLSIQALKTALSEAQQPLLDEIRSLREEVAGLRSDIKSSEKSLPALENKVLESSGEESHSLVKADNWQHGPIVRLALWLEQKLRS